MNPTLAGRGEESASVNRSKTVMHVVLSWSGPRSRAVATALKEALPLILPVTAWMSEQDIHKGDQWFAELMKNINRCQAGVICVTPDNVDSPWLNFEAGAIASVRPKGRAAGDLRASVCTFLLDVVVDRMPQPLSIFQATNGQDKAQVKRLIGSLNRLCSQERPTEELHKLFPLFWRLLNKRLAARPVRSEGGGPSLEEQFEATRRQLEKRRAALRGTAARRH